MQTADNQPIQSVSPSSAADQPVETIKSFSFTRRQLILISTVGSIVLLSVFGLGARAGEKRALRKQIMPQTQLTPIPIPPREQTDVRQNLEPSEFCKSYVAISIPNPAEVKKQSIELSVKNTGSAPVTGFSVEIEGNVTQSKNGGITVVSIGGIDLPEDLSGKFTVSGIDKYKNTTLEPGETLEVLIPIEVSGMSLLDIYQVEIIPSTAYQGSIIMCPDSKVSQSGGKYNYMRDKSLN